MWNIMKTLDVTINGKTYLTQAETRKFQGMKRVITAFTKKLLVGNVPFDEQIKEQFEELYTSKKSFVALADVYAKNILEG